MTRFSTLEFDDDEQEQVQQSVASHHEAHRPPVTDDFHYIKLADEKYLLGFFEDALKLYSRALSHNPNNVDGWIGQLRMLLELGELKEARLWSQKSLELFRNHADLLSLQAVAHCRLGDKNKAMQLSDAAFEQQGKGSLYMWLARGEVLLANRGKNVDFALDKAASMDGFSEWFRLLLVARVYYFYRHYSRALQKTRDAMEIKYDSPYAWHLLGNCQEATRQYKRAKQSYLEALKLLPEYPLSEAALKGLGRLGFFKRLIAGI